MDIVRAMTVAAATVYSFDPVQRHAVTVVTTDIDMRTVEREVGLQVMIESPNVPGDRVVAGVAAILEIALMLVIVAVTGYAADIFVLEGLA